MRIKIAEGLVVAVISIVVMHFVCTDPIKKKEKALEIYVNQK